LTGGFPRFLFYCVGGAPPPLPDLFYLIIFSLLLTFDTSGSMYLLQNFYRRGYEGTT
jgi:hypothetical protein